MKKQIVLLGIVIAVFFSVNSCSFEDEIVLDPGNITVFNDTPSPYEISIQNIDLNNQITLPNLLIDSGNNHTFPLDKGYSYQLTATEATFGKTVKNSFTKVFLIGPYSDNTWHILGK